MELRQSATERGGHHSGCEHSWAAQAAFKLSRVECPHRPTLRAFAFQNGARSRVPCDEAHAEDRRDRRTVLSRKLFQKEDARTTSAGSDVLRQRPHLKIVPSVCERTKAGPNHRMGNALRRKVRNSGFRQASRSITDENMEMRVMRLKAEKRLQKRKKTRLPPLHNLCSALFLSAYP